MRDFSAIPLLAYWDIYKNYYASKQEEKGVVIHTELHGIDEIVDKVKFDGVTINQYPGGSSAAAYGPIPIIVQKTTPGDAWSKIIVGFSDGTEAPLTSVGLRQTNTVTEETGKYNWTYWGAKTVAWWRYKDSSDLIENTQIKLKVFDLANIDTMKEEILAAANNPAPFKVTDLDLEPYKLLLEELDPGGQRSLMGSQEGLGIKTYQSDIYQNWINTEWVNEITSKSTISTTGNQFSIDSFIFAKKYYDLLNRIAVSGGSYDDWLDVVYTNERYSKSEIPDYRGGLSKEIVFDEVISTAPSQLSEEGTREPLGTLAGRGTLADKETGGQMTIKVDEPSYIIGIVSITPRIDYSQGNQWDIHLKTMNDLHKPGMDRIGFQDLITEQLAWWDTYQTAAGVWTQRSAGKQPAWLNYMTNYNRVKGNFAIPNNSDFMVLTRRYEGKTDDAKFNIQDLTTYIDPVKFNHVFAQTSLDSQNFWVQIGVKNIARRLISAKQIPNI